MPDVSAFAKQSLGVQEIASSVGDDNHAKAAFDAAVDVVAQKLRIPLTYVTAEGKEGISPMIEV